MNETQQNANLALPCRNLRCNQMYYLSAAQPDDYLDTSVFWCCRTQEAFGPDGQPIGRRECCAGRECFLE